MAKSTSDVSIYVAFRFHVNFYHSYRDDSTGLNGIGQDMRIIKYILDILDKHNAEGTEIKGTWDIENYYSLEQLMKEHCPELVERIKERSDKGLDEIEIMSYNNGLVSAHTEEEFYSMMEHTYSNDQGSGLKDIFGKYAPIVRSQECMMTPGLVNLYKKMGVEAITMFYSCIPFNGFSNFVPLLPTEKRYNPLWYKPPGRDDRIILMPCVNPADVYDNYGYKSLLKRLRHEQLNMDKPCDLILTVDMDADDLYWEGYLNTALSYDILKRKTPVMQGGLNIFINKLKKIPYVKFTTPYEYLKSHKPVSVVEFGQDTMDGSFDGFSPWSDKLENAKLWSGIERSRTLAEYARAVSGYDKAIDTEIKSVMKTRILTLSTTHFGLSTPVMCKPRLLQAFDKVQLSLSDSERILSAAKEGKNELAAYFPKKYYKGEGRKSGLIRVNGEEDIKGKGIKAVFKREVFGNVETDAIYSGTDEKVIFGGESSIKSFSLKVDDKSIDNGIIRLQTGDKGLELYYNGKRWTEDSSFLTKVNYNGKIVTPENVEFKTELIKGSAAIMTETGKLVIDSEEGKTAEYIKKYTVAADLPYLYADVDISYPMTRDYGVNKKKAAKLKRGYDLRWKEIMPLEIIPAFRGKAGAPIRVHKHNFFGDLSYFDYNYGTFSENDEIDSSNNALTCGFVAFTCDKKGILLAQSVAADNKFAFCPIRIRKDESDDKIFLNPFGSYTGNQLKYAAAYSGLSMGFTLKQAAQVRPCATSYRGGRQQFSLMVAPFTGQKPDDRLINDAIMHAYPPYILSPEGDKMIPFADWNNGEPLSDDKPAIQIHTEAEQQEININDNRAEADSEAAVENKET